MDTAALGRTSAPTGHATYVDSAGLMLKQAAAPAPCERLGGLGIAAQEFSSLPALNLVVCDSARAGLPPSGQPPAGEATTWGKNQLADQVLCGACEPHARPHVYASTPACCSAQKRSTATGNATAKAPPEASARWATHALPSCSRCPPFFSCARCTAPLLAALTYTTHRGRRVAPSTPE